ncbi:MAG: transposase [Rhodospirillales bacterium]|nr:transposase [Rhodospirillales bacterium]
MQQRSFGEVEGFRRQDKVTRRERFLDEMEQVMPWERLLGRIRPHYPVAGNGRRPYRLETMLRIHLMQQWFGYSKRTRSADVADSQMECEIKEAMTW